MRVLNICLNVIYFVTLWNFVKTNYRSEYDEGYGTEWIYFPDGDGTPHYVNLNGEGEELLPQVRGGFNDIEYRLYIRSNLTESIVLNDSAAPVISVDKDFELCKSPLKIITHGWRSSVASTGIANIIDAYLQRKDVNLITVDWSYIANSIFYHWVASQTDIIGVEIAKFLDALSERYNISGKQIHLIGHSLGAHVMGIAAFHTKQIQIDRITGLDPARPLFEHPSRNKSGRLDAKDACFVDIIHTCSGVLGIESNVGTVDFFPNNGIPPQPGCETIPKILEACSHGRSTDYFAESIGNPKAFPSYQCSNWTQYLENRCVYSVYMGEEVIRNITGKFYLKTNPNHPFGRTNT